MYALRLYQSLRAVYMQPVMCSFVNKMPSISKRLLSDTKLYVLFIAAVGSIVRVAEKRNSLSPAMARVFDNIVQNTEMVRSMEELLSDASTETEPSQLMEYLRRHAQIIERLDAEMSRLIDSEG